MAASLLIVFSGPLINKLFWAKKQQRKLSFAIEKRHQEHKETILASLVAAGIVIEKANIEMHQAILTFSAEISISEEKLKWLEEFLIKQEYIISFSI